MHLFVVARSIPCMPAFLCELLTITTMYDFKRGAAKKPIIESS